MRKVLNFSSIVKTLLFFSLACCTSGSNKDQTATVSVDQLIESPKKFNKKQVKVTGFIHFGFEENLLFSSKNEWSKKQYNKGIWIDRHNSKVGSEDLEKFSDQVVNIVGEFDSDKRGHLSFSAGEIRIDSIEKANH